MAGAMTFGGAGSAAGGAVTEVWLVRHTSVAVAPGVCYGRTDVPLGATFPAEAAAVREALAAGLAEAGAGSGDAPAAVFGDALAAVRAGFDAAWSSPLSRCTRLAAACGWPSALLDERLLELDFGTWEGRRFDEIDDPALAVWYADWLHARPGLEGETFDEQLARVASFLDDLRGWAGSDGAAGAAVSGGSVGSCSSGGAAVSGGSAGSCGSGRTAVSGGLTSSGRVAVSGGSAGSGGADGSGVSGGVAGSWGSGRTAVSGGSTGSCGSGRTAVSGGSAGSCGSGGVEVSGGSNGSGRSAVSEGRASSGVSGGLRRHVVFTHGGVLAAASIIAGLATPRNAFANPFPYGEILKISL